MKIVFLGVGEAADEGLPNNSHLVITRKTKLLLDCGFDIPKQLWKYNSDQNFLDAIYISHQHADHYFGLPLLLLRMWEEQRERKINIICQTNFKQNFKTLMDLAYAGFLQKFKFKINFIEVDKNSEIKFNDLKLSFAETKHSSKNLAIKINDGKKIISYSGDGMFNKKTEKLYKNSDLLIHETYLYNKETMGHGYIMGVIEMAKRNNIKCLALTHLQRDLRKKKMKEIKDKVSKKGVKVIIPNPLDKYNLT